MSCDHDLDAEYLYPADVRIASIDDADGRLTFTLVMPCPDCDEALEVTAVAESVAETEMPLLLEDSDEDYD